MQHQPSARLIVYLSAHHERQRGKLAGDRKRAFDAIAIILAANEPVMAMGGYTKYDPILTTQSPAQAVSHRRGALLSAASEQSHARPVARTPA